jgi:membrane-bound lytic murein transglycosylase B
MKTLQPVISLNDWKKRGVVPASSVQGNPPAIAIEFDGENGLEYWFGLQNFYTITRYNRSPMYAMAVYDLSLELKAAMNNANKKPLGAN